MHRTWNRRTELRVAAQGTEEWAEMTASLEMLAAAAAEKGVVVEPKSNWCTLPRC